MWTSIFPQIHNYIFKKLRGFWQTWRCTLSSPSTWEAEIGRSTLHREPVCSASRVLDHGSKLKTKLEYRQTHNNSKKTRWEKKKKKTNPSPAGGFLGLTFSSLHLLFCNVPWWACSTSTIRNKQVPFESLVWSPLGLCFWAGLPRGLNWASWSKNKPVCLIRSLSCRPRISAQSLVPAARTPREPSRSSEALTGRRRCAAACL